MAVLKKAVLIDYTKLKDMIDHGTIDNETVYFYLVKIYMIRLKISILKSNLKPIKLLFLI